MPGSSLLWPRAEGGRRGSVGRTRPGTHPALVDFPTPDDLKALRVSIARHPPFRAVLAGTLTLPCHVTYLRPLPTSSSAGRRAVQGAPRVKWTFLSQGREAEILVARGLKVKVSEGYRDRVSLPFYPESPTDATLVLTELRSNDSGVYRCDVQHGIEDGHDLVEVKVKGKPPLPLLGVPAWSLGGRDPGEASGHPPRDLLEALTGRFRSALAGKHKKHGTLGLFLSRKGGALWV